MFVFLLNGSARNNERAMRSLNFGRWILLLCMSLPLVSGKIHRYKWTVAYELQSPDCFKKAVIAINGGTPGPTIRAQQGDTIIVELKNGLLTENTAIHWHGIRQVSIAGGGYFLIIPGKSGFLKVYRIDWHSMERWHGGGYSVPDPSWRYFRLPLRRR